MGYTGPLDIFCKNQEMILVKIMGYTGQKLWDILWDIFVKTIGYICKAMEFIQKDWDIFG